MSVRAAASLVELMVVLVIIAVLAAITFPAYSGAVGKAKQVSGKVENNYKKYPRYMDEHEVSEDRPGKSKNTENLKM